MVILKPQGFGIAELMPPETLKSLGEEACWKLLHPNLLLTLDQLKKFFGYTMIINTWSFKNWQKFSGEPYRYRGYRPVGCGVGAVNGAHYKGLGIDAFFFNKDGVKIQVKEMQRQIVKNMLKFPHIVALEQNVGWNHIDIMTEKESPSRSGIISGKIFLFNVVNNKKSFIITNPNEFVKIV